MMKKLALLLALLFVFMMWPVGTVSAAAGSELTLSVRAGDVFLTRELTDGNCETKWTAANDLSLSVVSEMGNISGLYLVFDTPVKYSVNIGNKIYSGGQNGFIHEYVPVSESNPNVRHVYINLPKGATICDIYAFSGKTMPDWVQTWEPPCEKADLLLVSSHADDEQLFFAGVLPYYTQVKNYAVQVAYMTDHNGEIKRHHERLDGLWKAGVRHYPISSGYADIYSDSVGEALQNLASYDIDERTIVEYQKSVIARFQPQVIVTHDVNGEYGHGMHRLTAKTVCQAVDEAKVSFPFLKKVYLHSYDNGSTTLDFLDTAFAELGGKTPFEVSQSAFLCHKSQLGTWFKGWLFGSDGSNTSAATIQKYSPMKYGLYYMATGVSDAKKNDLMEGITCYEELDRIAKEEADRIAKTTSVEATVVGSDLNFLSTFSIIFGVVFILAVAGMVYYVLSKPGRKKRRHRHHHHHHHHHHEHSSDSGEKTKKTESTDSDKKPNRHHDDSPSDSGKETDK